MDKPNLGNSSLSVENLNCSPFLVSLYDLIYINKPTEISLLHLRGDWGI